MAVFWKRTTKIWTNNGPLRNPKGGNWNLWNKTTKNKSKDRFLVINYLQLVIFLQKFQWSPQGGIVSPGLSSAFSKTGHSFRNEFSYVLSIFCIFLQRVMCWQVLALKWAIVYQDWTKIVDFLVWLKKTSVNKHPVHSTTVHEM